MVQFLAQEIVIMGEKNYIPRCNVASDLQTLLYPYVKLFTQFGGCPPNFVVTAQTVTFSSHNQHHNKQYIGIIKKKP